MRNPITILVEAYREARFEEERAIIMTAILTLVTLPRKDAA